jgi:hypothetical protein
MHTTRQTSISAIYTRKIRPNFAYEDKRCNVKKQKKQKKLETHTKSLKKKQELCAPTRQRQRRMKAKRAVTRVAIVAKLQIRR